MSKEETAIATRAPGQIISDDQRSPLAIIPTSFTEIIAIAKVLVASNLTPFKSADQVALVILDALEKGKPMVQHLQSRYVVHGRVGMYADAMVADVLASGKARYIRPVEQSDTVCSWETVRSDWPEDAKSSIFSFTMAEAKQADFLSNAKYKEMPQRMLSARAKSYLCRDIYPDVMAGVFSVEELEDEEIKNPTRGSTGGRRAAPVTPATPVVEVSAEVVGTLTEPEAEPEAPEAPPAEEKPEASLEDMVRDVGKIIDEAGDTIESDPEAALEHLKKVVTKITELKDKGVDEETLSFLRTAYGDTRKAIRDAIAARAS